jgi:hypothetical protein
MASQGAVSLDTVMLNIESNAGHAVSNIDKLAASLANLKSAISGGFNNLNKLATSLENIKNASKGISGVADKLKNIGKIAEYVKPLESIGSTKNLGSLADNLKKLPEVMDSITPDTLENVGRVATELAIKLKPLADEMKEIAAGFNAMSTLARNYNVRIRTLIDAHNAAKKSTKSLQKTLTRLENGLKSVGKLFKTIFSGGKTVVKGLEKPFKRVSSKIKQMGFALLSVRSAFTFVRKAADEYLQMDGELQKAFTNTWRAMGAQLAPALEYVQYLFHQFVRVIYSVIYALTGIDLIARANEKAMKGWGKSAKDTLGNLQKFDDLNVVEFKKDTGGDDDQLIDMDKIDLTPIQKIVDWIKEVKASIEQALDTGKWKGVGEVFASGINDGITFLNNGLDTARQKVMEITTQIGEFFNGFVGKLDFGALATSISESVILFRDSITNIINTIDFKQLGKKLTTFVKNLKIGDMIASKINIFTAIFGGISDAVESFDWSVMGQKINDTIIKSADAFTTMFQRINWTALGSAIRDTIVNIDWSGIVSSVVSTIQQIISSAGGLFDGIAGTTVFSGVAEDINQIIGKIIELGETTIQTLSENGTVGKIFSSLSNTFKTISGFVGDIANKFLDWTISDDFQSAIELVNNILSDIFGWIDRIASYFKKIYDEYLSSDLDEILGYIGDMISDLKLLYDESLKPLIDNVISFWEETLEPIFGWLGDAIVGVVKALSGVVEFLTGVFTDDWEKAGKGAEKALGGIGDALKSLGAALVNFGAWLVEVFINTVFVKPLNLLISGWNDTIAKAFDKVGINISINPISKLQLPRIEPPQVKATAGGRANGGFVPSGQFFYANENGVPEYIGRIGNSAAVANNDQIVQGIKQGVKEAIQESDSTQPIVINLGNETLYKKQQQYNKLQNNKYGTINL